jgi:hypothetical protein
MGGSGAAASESTPTLLRALVVEVLIPVAYKLMRADHSRVSPENGFEATHLSKAGHTGKDG